MTICFPQEPVPAWEWSASATGVVSAQGPTRRMASAWRRGVRIQGSWSATRSGSSSAVRGKRVTLRPKELEALWADLAGADAARAYRAICTLAVAPQQTIPFLAKRLRPLEPADARLVARLIADLDNGDFGVRERASAGLEKLG